ncbi:MAG: TetR/AcrR family transcriptional regulator [Polyangiaceae bacterium]
MTRLRPTSLKPRKSPQQERARVLVDAIVEAATRILKQEGAHALNTNHIAELAGVSVGSLYQYFPNKQAILVAVIETQLAGDRHAARGWLDPPGATLEAQLRHMVRAMCHRHAEMAPLLGQLLPLVSQLEQEALVRRGLQRMSDDFDEFLAVRVDWLRPELADPEQRARSVVVLSDAIRGALNSTLSEPDRLNDPDFQLDLVRLSLGLLT